MPEQSLFCVSIVRAKAIALMFPPAALICHCLMNEWNIQSRAHACETCAKPFADKQPYHTLLFDEKQDFKRMDVCPACWEGQFSQGATERKGFVSYWQGTYEAPPPAPPEAIQKENAESLLRKIIESQDEAHAPAAYILAVMLERKRLLKVKEQIVRDGMRIFIYEHPKTGDVFTVRDPDLQLNQLDDVQRDVAFLLEHGLNAPASETPATTPAADTAQVAPDAATQALEPSAEPAHA